MKILVKTRYCATEAFCDDRIVGACLTSKLSDTPCTWSGAHRLRQGTDLSRSPSSSFLPLNHTAKAQCPRKTVPVKIALAT